MQQERLERVRRFLEAELLEVAQLQYDTAASGERVLARLRGHLHEHVRFTDPWQSGHGRDLYALGLGGFHAMFRFELTPVHQVAATVSADLRRARVMVDGVMQLRSLRCYVYPLRVVLAYELDLDPASYTDSPHAGPRPRAPARTRPRTSNAHIEDLDGDDADDDGDEEEEEEGGVRIAYRIRDHEEMWSFGDMLAALPLGVGSVYRLFRHAFAVGFLAACWLSTRLLDAAERARFDALRHTSHQQQSASSTARVTATRL